jgi:hypothetical protein
MLSTIQTLRTQHPTLKNINNTNIENTTSHAKKRSGARVAPLLIFCVVFFFFFRPVFYMPSVFGLSILIDPYVYSNNELYSRGGSRRKIWFFCVKSWFFTRNATQIFAPPSTIGKNMIFWRKIVIFHTKCHTNFRTDIPIQGRIQDFKLRGGAFKNKCTERREARKFLRYFVWKITILRQKIIFFPIVEGGAKICVAFRVKNHDFTPKNHIFSHCGALTFTQIMSYIAGADPGGKYDFFA